MLLKGWRWKGHWVGDYMSKYYEPWRVIRLIFETTRSILNNWSHVARPKQTNKQNTQYFSLSILKNKCESENRQEMVPVWGNNWILFDLKPKCSVSAEVQIKFSERSSLIFIYITFKINQGFLRKKKQDGESL